MNTPDVAIIVGSGSEWLLDILQEKTCHTIYSNYGSPSSAFISGKIAKKNVILLARHGDTHTIPPHKINYLANISALKSTGVKKIVAIAAVGGISENMSPGTIVIPDQIIDYTWGREHTFYNGVDQVEHVDFTFPYDDRIRQQLMSASSSSDISIINDGVYGAVQGPRLETAQEIKRMALDGCDLVGMTGMPEASLAREAGLDYACCAVVANWAAGMQDGIISMSQIKDTLSQSMQKVKKVLLNWVESL